MLPQSPISSATGRLRSRAMHTISEGYKGLSLLVNLNLDRFLMIGAIMVSLVVGGMIIAH
jgi:hypothetical protein